MRLRTIVGSIITAILLLPSASAAQEQNKDAISPKYEIRNTYYYERYSFNSDYAIGTSIAFTYRGLKNVILFGENIQQEKFRQYATLLKFGGAVRVTDKTTLMETIGFSSGKPAFANFLSDTGLTYMLMDKLSIEPGYSLYLYKDINTHVFYAGSTFYPLPRLYLNAKFFRALYDFNNEVSTSSNNSFLAKIGCYPDERNEVAFTYSRNTESFLEADQAGNFAANTYALGWNMNLTKQWGLITSVSYQDRQKPVRGNQKRVEAGLAYKW